MQDYNKPNVATILLWLLSTALVAVVPLLRPDGGLSLDSNMYFQMAAQLPEIEHNIYPIGYPVVLRLFNNIIGDYFWTSKILSLGMVLFIGIFAIAKRFYVQPTLILLSFKVVTGIFYFSFSETIYLPAFYLLFYCIHEYFYGRQKPIKFVICATLLFFFLYTIRYTTAYIGLGLGIFYVLYKWQTQTLRSFFKDPFFYFLLCSFLSLVLYIVWTLSLFPSAFGGDLREVPVIEDHFAFAVQNLIGLTNIANPIYSVKFRSLYGSRWLLQAIICLIDIACLWFAIKTIKKNPSRWKEPFWICVIVQIIVFAVAIFVSEYINYIDYINTRMIIVSSTLLFFMTLVFAAYDKPRVLKFMVILGYISVAYNFIFAVRMPVNYLNYRSQVQSALDKKTNAVYFFDDSKEPVVTTYNIPLINKSFSYVHAYYQPGYINENILMYLKPELKPIKDTIGIKPELLILNSEINSVPRP
jgi:hypothetical protein